ncbi:MAG: hypothetical protein WC777_01815 [Candidatus Gracilibacteria bacterium]
MQRLASDLKELSGKNYPPEFLKKFTEENPEVSAALQKIVASQKENRTADPALAEALKVLDGDLDFVQLQKYNAILKDVGFTEGGLVEVFNGRVLITIPCDVGGPFKISSMGSHGWLLDGVSYTADRDNLALLTQALIDAKSLKFTLEKAREKRLPQTEVLFEKAMLPKARLWASVVVNPIFALERAVQRGFSLRPDAPERLRAMGQKRWINSFSGGAGSSSEVSSDEPQATEGVARTGASSVERKEVRQEEAAFAAKMQGEGWKKYATLTDNAEEGGSIVVKLPTDKNEPNYSDYTNSRIHDFFGGKSPVKVLSASEMETYDITVNSKPVEWGPDTDYPDGTWLDASTKTRVWAENGTKIEWKKKGLVSAEAPAAAAGGAVAANAPTKVEFLDDGGADASAEKIRERMEKSFSYLTRTDGVLTQKATALKAVKEKIGKKSLFRTASKAEDLDLEALTLERDIRLLKDDRARVIAFVREQTNTPLYATLAGNVALADLSRWGLENPHEVTEVMIASTTPEAPTKVEIGTGPAVLASNDTASASTDAGSFAR